MKLFSTAVVFYGLLARSSAHWANSRLIVNGVVTSDWKYVLEVGDRNGYPAQGGISAQIDPIVNGEEYTDAITCGRSAFKSLEKTEIADINAGEEVGFKTSDSPGYNGGSMLYFHEGPGSAWLSRAPKDDLKSYQGDGDWFKIAYAGPKSNTEWKLLYKDSYTFTIPKTTPPGKYLLRMEQFMPGPTLNYTQFYANCALVNIKGVGGGTPKEFARFPGTYKPDDLGLWIPWNQTYGSLPPDQMAMLDYKPPGPSVWEG